MTGQKRALVFGATGQDGAYLCLALHRRGYDVFGTCRSAETSGRHGLIFLGISEFVNLKSVRLDQEKEVRSVISALKPDLVFNVAGITSVAEAVEDPLSCMTVNGEAVRWMLEGLSDSKSDARFFQASSAQIFGSIQTVPQTEQSPLSPENPYSEAKLIADGYVKSARINGQFAVSGILYNHESPLRGMQFVSRKIVSDLIKLKFADGQPLSIGALDSQKDWSFAGDLVEAMVLSLETDNPGDYILSSGVAHCVRDWVEIVCAELNIDLEWQGYDLEEVGVDKNSGRKIVEVDPRYFRKNDPARLVGDNSRARSHLGWEAKTDFKDLVRLMVQSELFREGCQPAAT